MIFIDALAVSSIITVCFYIFSIHRIHSVVLGSSGNRHCIVLLMRSGVWCFVGYIIETIFFMDSIDHHSYHSDLPWKRHWNNQHTDWSLCFFRSANNCHELVLVFESGCDGGPNIKSMDFVRSVLWFSMFSGLLDDLYVGTLYCWIYMLFFARSFIVEGINAQHTLMHGFHLTVICMWSLFHDPILDFPLYIYIICGFDRIWSIGCPFSLLLCDCDVIRIIPEKALNHQDDIQSPTANDWCFPFSVCVRVNADNT